MARRLVRIHFAPGCPAEEYAHAIWPVLHGKTAVYMDDRDRGLPPEYNDHTHKVYCDGLPNYLSGEEFDFLEVPR